MYSSTFSSRMSSAGPISRSKASRPNVSNCPRPHLVTAQENRAKYQQHRGTIIAWHNHLLTFTRPVAVANTLQSASSSIRPSCEAYGRQGVLAWPFALPRRPSLALNLNRKPHIPQPALAPPLLTGAGLGAGGRQATAALHNQPCGIIIYMLQP